MSRHNKCVYSEGIGLSWFYDSTKEANNDAKETNKFEYFFNTKNHNEDSYRKAGIFFNNETSDQEFHIDNVLTSVNDVGLRYHQNIEKTRESIFEDLDLQFQLEEPNIENKKNKNKFFTWKRNLQLEGGVYGLNFLKKFVDLSIGLYENDLTQRGETNSNSLYDQVFKFNFKLAKYGNLFFSFDTNESINTYLQLNFDSLGKIAFGFEKENHADNINEDDNQNYYFWNSKEDTFTTGIKYYGKDQSIMTYFKGNFYESNEYYAISYNDTDEILNCGIGYKTEEYAITKELYPNTIEIGFKFDTNNNFNIRTLNEVNMLFDISMHNINIVSDYSSLKYEDTAIDHDNIIFKNTITKKVRS